MSTKSGTCQWSNGRAVVCWANGGSEDDPCAKFTASGWVPTASREFHLEKTLWVRSFPTNRERLESDFLRQLFHWLCPLLFPHWERLGKGCTCLSLNEKTDIPVLFYTVLTLAMSLPSQIPWLVTENYGWERKRWATTDSFRRNVP
jgi:hypothetical protein